MRTFPLSLNDYYHATTRVAFVLRFQQYGSLHTSRHYLDPDPAYYRFKPFVSLFIGHSHYSCRTFMLSTRRMYASIANNAVNNPPSRHGECKPLLLTMMSTFQRLSSTWLSCRQVLAHLERLGFSHNKLTARDNDHYNPASVANETTNATGLTLIPPLLQRHTIDAIQH